MNMVTAVLVEGALTQANNDRDARKRFLTERIKEQLPIYTQLFRSLDKDGNGSITVRELQALTINDVPQVFKKTLQSFRFESMAELFEILDGNISGDIDEDEFIDGLLNLNVAEFQQIPPELIMTLKLSRSNSRRSRNIMKHLMGIHNELQRLMPKQDLQSASGDLPGL